MTKHDTHSEPATQPSITNADRAEYAAHALDQYGLLTEGRADYDRPEDMAADLICDLLHLIRAHEVEDPFRVLETARMNFVAEEEEELRREQPAKGYTTASKPTPSNAS